MEPNAELHAVSYAGFWKRFAAYLIDSIIMSAVALAILIPFIVMIGVGAGINSAVEDSEAFTGLLALLVGVYIFVILALIIAQWLYFALMESSSRRATLGKMALGIIVTDLNGGRLSFGKATGRYFGKIVSGMIFGIGYIMAAFTEKKQALHDMMAGTLVVDK